MKSLGSFEPFHKCTERSHGVSCVVNSFGPSLKLRPSVSLTGPKLILAVENVNREISSSLQVQAQRKLRCNSQMKLLHMIMYFYQFSVSFCASVKMDFVFLRHSF